MTTAFREEPVDLTSFVTSPRYLGLPRLSAAQFRVVQLAEKIFSDDTYAELAASRNPATARYYAELAGLPMVNTVVAQVGQGAGKDMMAALISARIGYLLSCCENPQEAFGMPRAAKIHLLNCAASAPQANDVFFSYLTGMVGVEDGWFARWFASRPKSEKAGVLARSIGFGRNVLALSGHSDAATQQGLNLLVAVADEIDEFEDDDVWNMAVSSAPSRFPRVHKLIALSWPRHSESKIRELTWRGRELGTAGGWYVIGPASTFAVNPTKSESDFAQFARQNPALYAARYLCRPALSANPVFANESVIDTCFTREARPRVRVLRYEREGAGYKPVWEVSHELLRPWAGTRYWLHIDASRVKDKTAVAMSHVADWRESADVSVDAEGRELTRTGYRPVVVLDFITTLSADLTATPPRPIQPADTLTLIRLLQSRHFSIERVSCDWYGLPFYEEPLTQLGIKVERLTTDLASRGEAVWEALADAMYDGRLSGPWDPILVNELRGLTRTDTGKIDHSPTGSKDCADAVACCVFGAIRLGGSESGPADGAAHEFAPADAEPLGGIFAGAGAGMPGLPIGSAFGMGSDAPRLSPYGGSRPHH